MHKIFSMPRSVNFEYFTIVQILLFLVHNEHFLRIFFNVMENFSRFFLNFKMYYHTYM